MKLLTEADKITYLARDIKEDGEVVGLGRGINPDDEPYTLHWNEDDQEIYVSADTISQWGIHNLNQDERIRCGFSDREVEMAEAFYAREGHGITLSELESELAISTPRI